MTSRRYRLRELSFLRKRRRENEAKKRLRIKRSQRLRVKRQRQRNGSNYYAQVPQSIIFDLPTIFSFHNNADGLMWFVNNVYNVVNKDEARKIVDFNLSDVQYIDNEAISLLLALTNAIAKKKCWVKGNAPKNDSARKIFINSGFYDHVGSLLKRNIDKGEKSGNLMIEAGTARTKNNLVGAEIRKAMKYLTGKAIPYRPAYSIIQEICGNSVEHANENEMNKNWLISVFYENSVVIFTMVDIGKGILGTLKKKISQTIRDTAMFSDNVATLRGAFTKRYQSSTWEENRNKGLPKINDYQEKGYISNLLVITNNVYLDLEGNTSHQMKTNFRGTFYTWTLNQENIQKWEKRLKSA